jgi:putative signal transducing protein
MRELLRTNDPVRLSYIRALLSEAGIAFEVFDTHMSILEGNANFIAPRLMVDADDYERARRVLREAGVDGG